ncbi:MAG: C4-type zinc ribbon domain-containing protein [Collinsella sp.]|nr:C4-type zinc ribbon domain-containing protein [Collinsella sp.]
MSTGQVLADIQELDLALMRDAATLKDMPEVRELARKRRAYLKLKAEGTRLAAEQKDIETDLADLDEDERSCTEAVEAAQAGASGLDYREVQDLEIRLSDLAKRLDKIAHARAAATDALAEHVRREEQHGAYVAALERAITDETRAARALAGEIQGRIERNQADRARLAAALDEPMLARYEAARARFGGLAVEVREGAVPSVCRTTLSAASLSDLDRGGEVGECPYCHRILVTLPDEEDA